LHDAAAKGLSLVLARVRALCTALTVGLNARQQATHTPSLLHVPDMQLNLPVCCMHCSMHVQVNGAHSTPITPMLTRMGPAAAATGTGDASYYLEHSIDEDIIVMNSLTDWSMGASGMAQGSRPGMPVGNNVSNGGNWRGSSRASRSLVMPQIVEGPSEEHEAGAGFDTVQEQQQQLQLRRRQPGQQQQQQQQGGEQRARELAGRAAAEAQLLSLEGEAQGAQQQQLTAAMQGGG
jgi:hypothetical protein